MIETNINALRCPHCGTKVALLKKLFIDPRYKSKGIITLPKSTTTFTIIWMSILAIIIFILRKHAVAVYIIGGVSIAVYSINYLFFIPIVGKEGKT